jgi:16S rRNA (uracil1498-N3)-methyltransferase
MVRLLIDQFLTLGAEIALDEAQARHVGTVLRLEAGAAVRVFNANDGEWRASVSVKTKRAVAVRVEEFLHRARAVPELDLLFAPVKRHATDLIVEKATELGVRRIRPVTTQRTIAETVRLDRLNAIAREAAEQTERFDAPEICAPVSLAKALDGWDGARALIFADEAGDAGGILDALQALRLSFSLAEKVAAERPDEGRADSPTSRRLNAPHPPAPSPPRDREAIPLTLDSPAAERPVGGGGVSLLVGPEGGFTSEERAMLRACAFVIAVSLGPRILRAETAVIAALSIIQAAWGDWREA